MTLLFFQICLLISLFVVRNHIRTKRKQVEEIEKITLDLLSEDIASEGVHVDALREFIEIKIPNLLESAFACAIVSLVEKDLVKTELISNDMEIYTRSISFRIHRM